VFNIGFSEMLVICLVLIIVVGPERLPAMMKTVGKAIRGVRQASRDIQSTVGLDELWREDLLHTPPPVPPLAPPLQAPVSRDAPVALAPQAAAQEAPLSSQPPAAPEPAGSSAASAVNEVAPAPAVAAPGGSKGEA
jgi:sec-independent protein translocase protein TatB